MKPCIGQRRDVPECRRCPDHVACKIETLKPQKPVNSDGPKGKPGRPPKVAKETPESEE